MFDNILVPLDGSRLSEVAIPYAQALAKRTRGRVTLFRAASAAPTALGLISERHERAVDESDSYLIAIAERLRDEGLMVDAAVGYGWPAQLIISANTSRNIDLVVMATHDSTGAKRWTRGSVAETVIGHVGVPVLLVHASNGAGSVNGFRTQHPVLIVPLDGSELAEAALPVAGDLAVALNGRIMLVGVGPYIGQPIPILRGAPTSLAEQDYRQVREEASAYLRATASRLESQCEIATDVRFGEPGREINRAAEEHGATAIVMATHGRTGLFRTLLGSVAGQVVHSSSTPVLLVHAAGPLREGQSEPTRIGWGMQLEETCESHRRM